MKMTVDLNGEEYKVTFSGTAMNDLIQASFPLIKMKDIIEKHKSEFESLADCEEYMVVDAFIFTVVKGNKELYVERIIKESL